MTWSMLIRWMLVLAAVHTWSGEAMIGVVVVVAAAEYLRSRWLDAHPPPWAP